MKLKKGSAAAKAYMAKIRAKRNVGAVAKTKTGKVAKRLNKAQSDYNKDVDAYKYFVVVNNKITEGYEFKSDAIDAANEYEPKAKILTKQGLKKAGITNTSSQWKYTLGAAKTIAKFKKGDLVKIKGKSWIMKVDNIRQSNYGIMYYLENDVRGTGNGNPGTYFEIDLEKISNKKVGSTLKLKANEKRLGATPADLQANGYHKDTKSHNVRINVLSGTKKVTQKLEDSLEWIKFYNEQLTWWKNYKPQNIYERKGKTDSIKFYTKSLSNEKKHLALIKKTI
jgi:hypothetical protein